MSNRKQRWNGWMAGVAVALVCLTAAPAMFAADVRVVANSSLAADEISADDLKQVFLASKTSITGGAKVKPVCLKSGPAHEAFLTDYVGKSDAAYLAHFRKLVFTGKGAMPKTFATEAEVLAYVAETEGAVGYVSGGSTPSGVKTLAVK